MNGLTKSFNGGTVKAVDDVSFTLAKGEIGCIIGTSGCGKTTTLKMINRLVEPSSGSIEVDGVKFNELDSVKWRRKMGYVIQNAALFPHLTVEGNISLLSTIMKRDKDCTKLRVKELMETINMPYEQFHNRYPKELSGGQKQRVGIARALVEDPPVVLMDEPFGALDPITRNSLHEEFLELNSKLHKTFLIVTHDLEEAFKLGDKVILMDKGQIIQMGNKDDFLSNPKNDFVASFVEGFSS